MRLFGGFGVGRWFGFQIRIDYSWFLIFFLVVWTFAAGEFPRQMPGATEAVYYAMGTAGALLLFLSVLLHELSHSAVARSRGLEVEGITLFIFGGVAQTRMEARTPADEFLLTAAGPLCSLALGGAFWGLAEGAGALGAPEAVVVVTRTLAVVNVALAVFNMIPGFPLDGGRIFRSTVWWITGDARRATRWATRIGQAFGWLLVGVGAYAFLVGQPALNGLWSAFIGWFLASAAGTSWDQFEARRVLSGVRVDQIMSRDPVAVEADTTVDAAVRTYFLRHPHGAYPVMRDGELVGLVSVDDVARVEPGRRAATRVAEVATPLDAVPTVRADTPLDEVLTQVSSSDADRALVVDGGRLAGLVTLRQIGAWLERAKELEMDEEEAPAARPEREGPTSGDGTPGTSGTPGTPTQRDGTGDPGRP